MTHRHPRPRCRPPPLSLTHMHKYTNTPTHILISTSNLHSFRNISPVFSSPAEQMLAVCVSLPLDCTNRLPEVFFFSFAQHRFFSASSPVKQFVHVPSYLLCDFAVDHYFTLSRFTLKPSPPSSKHSYLECLPTCAAACSLKPHLLFTTKCFFDYFPVLMNSLLKVFMPPLFSSSVFFFLFFFNLSSAVWRLFTAPSVRNTSVSVSTGLLLCFDIRYFCLASSPLARLFASLSPGYHTPAHSLSFNVFQDVSRLIRDGCRHPHTQVAIITYSQFSCCEM